MCFFGPCAFDDSNQFFLLLGEFGPFVAAYESPVPPFFGSIIWMEHMRLFVAKLSGLLKLAEDMTGLWFLVVDPRGLKLMLEPRPDLCVLICDWTERSCSITFSSGRCSWESDGGFAPMIPDDPWSF